ncbi:MAG: hypothetical protein OEM06_12300 [Desulfobacteraceae bacterium]|nr:hypothetical protein [Desulfobacteraceae bacterium]
MKKIKNNLMVSLVGITGGLSSVIPAYTCSGGGCVSCYKCMGLPVALLILLLSKNVTKKYIPKDDNTNSAMSDG